MRVWKEIPNPAGDPVVMVKMTWEEAKELAQLVYDGEASMDFCDSLFDQLMTALNKEK